MRHCQRATTWRPFILLLQLNWLATSTFGQQQQQLQQQSQSLSLSQQPQQQQQHAGFSLQAAVDELHRREAAKYPLNAPPYPQRFAPGSSVNEPEYFDDDNTAPYSVFRERDNNAGLDSRTELTDQFLREIEQTNEREHQERYKEALRHLWEQYQQQENEINDGAVAVAEQKKRMRVPPYYTLMQKRSPYPILPWLPYEKNKRFPVAKRSTKRFVVAETVVPGETDDRVAKELSELFTDTPSDEKKKKRSTDGMQLKSISATSGAPAATTTIANDDMRLEGRAATKRPSNETTLGEPKGEKEQRQYAHVGHEAHNEHKHRKRSEHREHRDHSSHEDSEEFSDEDDEHEEHEGVDDEDEHDEFDEIDEQERRKKKRAVSEQYFWPGELPAPRRKKSIDWSKYFGLDLDRRKKSLTTVNNELDEDKQNKRTLNPENIENMDKKLQSIEDFIIGETVKYTGAHEGITDQDEIRKVKDHVLSRLATAYSLEKMRRSLEKLRQSVETENHLLRNVIGADQSIEKQHLAAEKRLTIKKEKPEVINQPDTVPPFEPKPKDSKSSEALDDNDISETKRKRKRNRYLRYPELPNELNNVEAKSSHAFESLNDAYLGNKNYLIGSNQCPLIESMAERCRGIDLLSGDLNQELLPICGVHQICYLCGTSQIACDYQYLADADILCGTNSDCQSSARSALMILRGNTGPHIGPRECIKNPCLYSAMREIGL